MKTGKMAYGILSVKDFRVGMLRRNVKVQPLDHASSRNRLMKITQTIWKEHVRDVNELTTVFYLSGMNARLVAYAFRRCMRGKRCTLSNEKYIAAVLAIGSRFCEARLCVG